MINLTQISKSYAGRTLFEDVSMQINRDDRTGLVGPNGAGKTTLFSIILKEIPPDTGAVHVEKGVRLGYLPQENAPAGDETVLELASAVSGEITALKRLLAHHEKADTTDDPAYHDARTEFDHLGGYQLEPKAKKILTGLAFRSDDFDRPARELSGGWIMRLHLARLLVMEPDLLLLDEPTNHLDLESLGWFQNYLLSYPGAILVISHDRAFLNSLTNGILEIDSGVVSRYTGNYDVYEEQKESRFQQLEAAYLNQQREIARLTRFIDRFRAKATKAAQAQSKIKQLEKMTRLEAPVRSNQRIRFSFPQPERGGQRTVTIEHAQQSYGDLTVYRDLNFSVDRGERIVLVGPNGAGKSTLVKILAGAVPIDAGIRKLGHNVSVGYYTQHRTEMLDPGNSVLQTVMSSRHTSNEERARTLLGSFLFRGDDVFKSTGVLSGGEKSRLALIRFLLNPPNLLLMDEPTTHLDMPSIETLVQALEQYEGTLVFISHDVHFINSIANNVVHIDAGALTRYAGGYDYYLEKSGASSARAALTAGQPLRNADASANLSRKQTGDNGNANRKKSKEQKRREAAERQERAHQRKSLLQRLSRVEERIMTLETRERDITTLLEDPQTYSADPGKAVTLNRELVDVSGQLEEANAEWGRLAEAQEISETAPSPG